MEKWWSMAKLHTVLKQLGFKINQYVKIYALVNNLTKIFLINVLMSVNWIETLMHFLKKIYMKLDQMAKI